MAVHGTLPERTCQPIQGRRRTEVAVAPLSSDSVRELWGVIGAIEGFAVRATSHLPPGRRELLAVDLGRLNDALRAAFTWEREAIRTIAMIDGLDQHDAPRRKDKSRTAPRLRQR